MSQRSSSEMAQPSRSWEALPDRLANVAREVVAELQDGRPGTALDLLDGMLAELEERRRLLADLANTDG
jgi:hypothetical protein